MNHRPRPVFQSYSAYSAALCNLNERFYASAAQPDKVLQRYRTIDNRFTRLDDAGALQLLTDPGPQHDVAWNWSGWAAVETR